MLYWAASKEAKPRITPRPKSMSRNRDQAQKSDSPYNEALRIIKEAADRKATGLKLSNFRLLRL